MNRNLLLGGAIAAEVLATLSLRAMEGLAHPYWLILVVVGYAGAFLLLSQLTKTDMPIGAIYAIWAASGIALTAVLGMLLFSEKMTALMTIGVAMIITGVIMVELGSKPDNQSAGGQ